MMRVALALACLLLSGAAYNLRFRDVARSSGLDTPMVFGGVTEKKYILETTGSGVALLDYNNDGWTDIFLVNGTTLNESEAGSRPTNHLYRNLKNGKFEDVTVRAGLVRSGWGRECVQATITTMALRTFSSLIGERTCFTPMAVTARFGT